MPLSLCQTIGNPLWRLLLRNVICTFSLPHSMHCTLVPPKSLKYLYCDWATGVLINWQILICWLASWRERQNKKLLSMCFRHSAMAALIWGFFGLPSLMIYSQSARYCALEFVWGSPKDSEAISQGNGETSRLTVWSSKLCFLWRPDLKNSCAIFF